jgi:hypothetical protein
MAKMDIGSQKWTLDFKNETECSLSQVLKWTFNSIFGHSIPKMKLNVDIQFFRLSNIRFQNEYPAGAN